jgi:hypothetical protein
LDPDQKLAEIHENNNKAFTIIQLENRDFNCVNYSEVFPRKATNNEVLVTGLNDDEFDKSGILVYPNPANNAVQVKYKLSEPGVVEYRLHDLSGKLLRHEASAENSHGNLHSTINTEDLNKGIYLLSFHLNGQSFTKKLSIIK